MMIYNKLDHDSDHHVTGRSTADHRKRRGWHTVCTVCVLVLLTTSFNVFMTFKLRDLQQELQSLEMLVLRTLNSDVNAESINKHRTSPSSVTSQEFVSNEVNSISTNDVVTTVVPSNSVDLSEQVDKYDMLNDTTSLIRRRRDSPVDGVGGHGEPMRGPTEAPPNRHRNTNRSGVVHFEIDGSVYGLEIRNEGDVIKSWSQRRESRRNRANFGVYQQENGIFKITKNGLYLIYSQLTYYDNSGRWCHAVKRGSEIIAKCLASEWGMSIDANTNRYVPTVHNCYTSTVTFLRRNEEISIISLYGSRTVHQGPEMSFWGIVRLG